MNSVFGIKNTKFIISLKKNDQTSAFDARVVLAVAVNDGLWKVQWPSFTMPVIKLS